VKTVPLSEARGYAEPVHVAASDEAKLYAEISERILELVMSTGIVRFNRWLSVLAQLRARDHEAELWFIRFQTGDLSWIKRSYAEIGAETGRSKQAVEQSFTRALVDIRSVNPMLADAIAEYRGIKSAVTKVM